MVYAVLVLAPLLALGLWFASGREMLTKTEKPIQVKVVDPVFGDTIEEWRFVPGRLMGYYVGLDAVAVTAAVSGVAGGLAWRLGRRAGRTEKESDR